ncbi:MAG TPA: DinB family protein [Candidatus Acidoferrales bacterium]|nr:DinB family protein [Candidatus Acidoferrales bacterium]
MITGASREKVRVVGRPESREAAPYYFTYIDQVEGDDVLHVLERQLDELPPFFVTISEEKSLHRYAGDKWSIRQVLNHLNDTERLFAFRALWFARGFETPLPSFDQNVAVSGAAADGVSWTAHVEEFRRVHLATLSLFTNLPPDAWMRSGIASEKPFTVRALAFLAAGHTTHHVRILRERYL